MHSRDDKPQTSIKAVVAAIFLILLSLGFLKPFVFDSTMIYLQSADWQPVRAQLQWLEIDHKYSYDDHGNQTRTSKLLGEFSYLYQGRQYTSQQISTDNSYDNFSDWSGMQHRIQQQANSGRLFALVNPAQPTQALLDRQFKLSSIPITLIFMLVFWLPAGLLIRYGIKGKTPNQIYDQQQQGIQANNVVLYLLWGCMVFIGIFAIASFSIAISTQKVPAIIFAAVFILGLAALARGIKKSKARHAIVSPLILEKTTAQVGRTLKGRFSIDGKTHGAIKLGVLCQSGSGDNSHTLFNQSCKIKVTEQAGQQMIEFAVALPSFQPASSKRISWELCLSSSLSTGVAYMEKPLDRTWSIRIAEAEKADNGFRALQEKQKAA